MKLSEQRTVGDINYRMIKDKFKVLYFIFVKNQHCTYNEFISIISEKLNKNVDEKYLRRFIGYVKSYISAARAEEMTIILDNVKSNNNSNKEKLDYVDSNGYIYGSFNKELLEKITIERQQVKKEEALKKINKNIDIVLSEKKDHITLHEEGKVTYSNLLTVVKNNLSDIDFNKYIEFIITDFNVKEINYNDVDQYIEVVNYFLKNINDSISRLSSIDINSENAFNEINSVKTNNEECSDDRILNSKGRLYKWKLNRLSRLLEKYQIYFEMLNNVKEKKNLDELPKLSGTITAKYLNDDFLYDYYKMLRDFSNVYKKHIKDINTIGDDRKEEIDNLFIKRLIKENN